MKIVASPLDRDEKKRDKKRPQEFTETAVKEVKAHVKKTRSTQKQEKLVGKGQKPQNQDELVVPNFFTQQQVPNFAAWKEVLGQAESLCHHHALLTQHSSIPPPEPVKRIKILLLHDERLPALCFTMPSDSSVRDTVKHVEEILRDEGFGGRKVKSLQNSAGDQLVMCEQIKNVLEDPGILVPQFEVVAVAQPTCNGGHFGDSVSSGGGGATAL
jgi:hypothetical protein